MSARGFPVQEYRNRTARAQSAMASVGFGALLLTSEVELRYFAGFLTRFWESPTRPWFLVLPAKGDPIAVIPAIGALLMARGWIADIRTWRAPDYSDDGIGLLAETLQEVAGNSGAIGVPDGIETHIRMPFGDFERLKSLLGAERFRGDQGLARNLREIKSEGEIDKIRTACHIAGRAFARVPEIASVGQPLSQIFRDFQRICLDEGADWVPYLAGGAGSGGYDDVISPSTEDPLENGDILMLDTGLIWDGYFCDFDRNWSLGSASDTSRRAHDALVEAVDAAAALAKPGAAAADLFHAMDARLTGGAGGSDAGRLGHGLGMHLTEGLSLIPADRTVLEPGMVLTLEPGISTVDGRIMVHEENIVIREHGPEFLSPRIVDLPEIAM